MSHLENLKMSKSIKNCVVPEKENLLSNSKCMIPNVQEENISFKLTVRKIVELRRKVEQLKTKGFISKEGSQEESKMQLIALRMAEKFLQNRRETTKIIAQIRSTFDLYSASKRVLITAEKDPPFHEILMKAHGGTVKALHAKLTEFLEAFPVRHANELNQIIKKMRHPEWEKDTLFDPSRGEDAVLKDVQSLLQNVTFPNQGIDEKLYNETKLHLETLAGAMVCVASILDPSNELEGFENVIPDLEKLSLNAKNALENLQLSVPESMPSGDKQILKIGPTLLIVNEMLDKDLKTYHVNVKLAKSLQQESKQSLEEPATEQKEEKRSAKKPMTNSIPKSRIERLRETLN